MENNYFYLIMAFLLSSLCVATSQDWDCQDVYIQIALVYDCRYSLDIQQDFFTRFIDQFQPVPMPRRSDHVYVNSYMLIYFLMTYVQSKLLTFETLTMDNFTQEKFNEATLKINISSCPRYLPLKSVFNDTRDVFISDSSITRNLAIFVLGQNIADDMSDDSVPRWLDEQQSLNVEVKRLFILINPRVEQEVKRSYSFYTRTLKAPDDVIQRVVRLICNSPLKVCNGYGLAEIEGRCYTKIWQHEMSANESAKLCDQKWPQSSLLSLNSQRKYEIIVSHRLEMWPSLLQLLSRENAEFLTSLNIKTFLLGFNFAFFIGLSSRTKNGFKEYVWNDGTPLVVEPQWVSRNEGEGCVYMSVDFDTDNQNYSFNIFNIVLKQNVQWLDIDCNEIKKNFILFCEWEIPDTKRKQIHFNVSRNKKQKSKKSLLYKSYSNFLLNQMYAITEDIVFSGLQLLSYKIINIKCRNSCRKSEEHLETYEIKHNAPFDGIHPSIPRVPTYSQLNIKNINSLLFDDICQWLKNKETKQTLLSNRSIDVRYYSNPNVTVPKCLYEVDSDRRRLGFPNNSHLQGCEQFMCPPGFVKCPDAYCLPVYLVHDGLKDCPYGEDEVYVNNETSLCSGNLKFTLRNICLQQDICNAYGQCSNHTSDFVCQVPCDTGYVCLSNIVRKGTGNDTTYHISFVETIVQIYENLGVFTFTPQIYSLFQFFKLVEVDLSKCRIRDLDNVIESLDSSDVIILDVSRNSISGHNFSVIHEMKNLQKLNMSFNKHLEFHDNFIFPVHLQVLDMSHTQIGSFVIHNLINFTHLKVLKLCNVEPIDLSITGNVKLDILDVRGTEIINIKDGYLSWLSIQTALYTDDFRICCQVIRGPKIPPDKCHAPRDAISTCQDLIGDPQKRVILWVVGILSLLGNMVVVIYRIIWDRAVFNKAYGLFVVCLCLSDFVMGVYLIIIAWADLLYRNRYVFEDTNWRYSNICKLAGILSTFSSETSTMFICLITLDRYLVMKYPFGQHRFSKTGKITSLCLTLIIGVVVSLIPVLFPGWEIYSSNGMCLALPFSSGRHTGWEYSAVLFVGLNFFLFILITIGQLAIFRVISSYKDNAFSSARDDSRKAQELSVARQLFLVAASDFCCWFPIGIMGIMSLSGFQFNLDVYAWSAVLVLPINSAINPFIYTLPAILRRIRSGHVMSQMTSYRS